MGPGHGPTAVKDGPVYPVRRAGNALRKEVQRRSAHTEQSVNRIGKDFNTRKALCTSAENAAQELDIPPTHPTRVCELTAMPARYIAERRWTHPTRVCEFNKQQRIYIPASQINSKPDKNSGDRAETRISAVVFHAKQFSEKMPVPVCGSVYQPITTNPLDISSVLW